MPKQKRRREGEPRRAGSPSPRNHCFAHGRAGAIEGGALELALAMDKYKRDKGRAFPAWSEVYGVLVSLGYRKVDDSTKSKAAEPSAAPPSSAGPPA